MGCGKGWIASSRFGPRVRRGRALRTLTLSAPWSEPVYPTSAARGNRLRSAQSSAVRNSALSEDQRHASALLRRAPRSSEGAATAPSQTSPRRVETAKAAARTLPGFPCSQRWRPKRPARERQLRTSTALDVPCHIRGRTLNERHEAASGHRSSRSQPKRSARGLWPRNPWGRFRRGPLRPPPVNYQG